MGHKISKEQIDPGVKDHIMSFVGDVADLETEVNSDIISAVNSLMADRVDNAENMGKLANAIGEPVTANHTVDEVVEGLGEMLSTFKTNMMNSGVMVESNDKFKQLIDKIKGLTEGEGNKGIQFAEGTADNINLLGNSNTGWVEHKVNINVPFTPNRIILYVEKMVTSSSSGYYIKSFNVDSEYCFSVDSCFTLLMYGATYLYITDITNEGFSVYTKSNITTGTSNEFVFQNIRWYAIGVGEEDTTLRDSLASILEEEGVEVTEEDDMASLITKVDEEFENKNTEMESNKGLDIISATELPATGSDGQICVITDNPVNEFVISTNPSLIDNKITLYSSTSTTSNYVVNTGNIEYTFNIYKVSYNATYLKSYYWKNNNWIQLTDSFYVLLLNGITPDNALYTIQTGSSVTYDSTYEALKFHSSSTSNHITSTAEIIDFDLYTKVEIDAISANGNKALSVGKTPTSYMGEAIINNDFEFQTEEQTITHTSTTEYGTYIFDISNMSGTGYLSIMDSRHSTQLYIKNIRLY